MYGVGHCVGHGGGHVGGHVGGNGVGHAGGGHGVGHAGGCSSSWWTWWLFCFEGGSRCMLVVPQR